MVFTAEPAYTREMSSGKLLVEAHSDGVRGAVGRVGSVGGDSPAGNRSFCLFLFFIYRYIHKI